MLTEEESAAVSRAIGEKSPEALKTAAQSLVRALIARGELEIVETLPEGRGRRLRLRARDYPLRFSIRLDDPPPRPAPVLDETPQVVELPLEGFAVSDLQASLVRQLLLEQGALVLADRVAGPREVVQRLEPIIRKAVAAESVWFLPIDAPPGEFWRSGRASPAPIPAERIREIARARAMVLYARDFSRLQPPRAGAPHAGSAIYIGVGDDLGGWRGVLEIRDSRPDAFGDERIGLAVLLATHFQTLLASTVRLQSLIFFDFLTGLYNRPYFEDQLEKQLMMARRRGQSLALCIIDIDDFKNFNTRYGYEGGDRVLVTVGCVLKAALRASDTLARYGGEEFAALLAPPVTPEEAMAIAERLRAAVESEPFQVQSLSGEYVPERIAVSVGGALFPDHGQTVREIWTVANRMLLDAKQKGKNRTRFAPESRASGDTGPPDAPPPGPQGDPQSD